MRKSLRIIGAFFLLIFSVGSVSLPHASAAPTWLEQCVTNVNDPLFDKAFLLSLVGYATEADFEAKVADSTWTVQLATGSGQFGTHRGNQPDLYCGNSQNNSRDYLDSTVNSRDFFIGGAGNDRVTGDMWFSTFYGGEGDDSVFRFSETSYFYGGPGNDQCENISSDASTATCLTDGGPTPAVPGTPPAPTAVAGNASATVTVAAGTGGTPSSYLVTSTPGSATCTVAGASGSCAVTGLTNGTSYTFKATATNGGGTSAASAASVAVTPQPAVPGTPPAPTAVAGVASAEITVAAGTGGTPASYLVTSTPGSRTCTVTGASGSCTVTGLTNGTSYTFTATATNGGGTSGSSAVSTSVTPQPAVPGTPLRPVADAGVSSAEITVAAGTGGTPASYLVTSTPGSRTCTVTGASGSCTVTGLTNGTSYTFKATATNGGGTSAASAASVAVTPQPAAPGTPPAPTAVAGNASATVTVAAGTGGTPSSYLVTSTPGSATCTVTGASGSCTVTGLTNGTSYTFKATATNDGGTSGASAASVAVTPTAPAALIIDVQAPVNTVAAGQASVATIVSTTSTLPSANPVQGAITSTKSTTTTTSTTLPRTTTTVSAPQVVKPSINSNPAPDVPSIDAGQGAVIVGGVATNAAISRENNQMVVRSGEVSATFSSTSRKGQIAALDSDGVLRLVNGDLIKLNLSGFQPFSIVRVWMFSTPYNLGQAKVAADGSISASFTVPNKISRGKHRIAVVAVLPNGKQTTIAVGVTVGKESTTSTTTRLLIGIPISLAVLAGVLIPTRLRRRRSIASAIAPHQAG